MNKKNNEQTELTEEEKAYIEAFTLEELGLEEPFKPTNRRLPWPKNLYVAILGEDDGKVLNERAGDVFLEALQTLTPQGEIVIRQLYKEQKCLADVAKELNVAYDDIRAVKGHALRKMRHPSFIYYMLRQQGIYEGQNGPLPESVPTEEQKAFILQLAKEKGVKKERANRGFIHNCIRTNPDSVLKGADYGVVDKLIEYLQEAL